MVTAPIIVHNKYQEGFGQYTDQNTSFKSSVETNVKALENDSKWTGIAKGSNQ